MAYISTTSNDSNLSSSALQCFQVPPYSIILSTIFLSIILFLLPLYIFIIHHGLQQWMKKSSSSSSVAAMSHSDCFTYNMVLMELVGIVGYVVHFSGIFKHNVILSWSKNVLSFSWMGKMLLQVLTCVERYLAVVHPITYMRLKNRKGTRIRNATIVCVWLISGVSPNFKSFTLSIVAICLAAVCFCSVSVLVVLVRPGPGEQGGNRKWADPSKKRAFYTIVVILGVLGLRISGDIGFLIVQRFGVGVVVVCVIEVYLVLLEQPNSLVLPLLFLLKHGRTNK